ncbi:MAG: cation transporter [Azoarcus sp.]|nr:cation transporter [Azoarcus sp.]
MNTTEFLQHTARLAVIAHHIPGRIRLKLNESAENLPNLRHQGIEAGRFCNMLVKLKGIRRVNVNRLARSVTVEYDNQTIPDQAWRDLWVNPSSPEAAALINRLRDECPQLTD